MVINSKKKQFTILSILLSLPISAIALSTLSGNRLNATTKHVSALSYVSTQYDGYRLLTSQYGIMDGVKLVIADGTHVMSKTSQQVDGNIFLVFEDEDASFSGNVVNTTSETCLFDLKTGVGNGFYMHKQNTEKSHLICYNPSGALKYGSATDTTNKEWTFAFNNGKFNLYYPWSSGSNLYVGFRTYNTGSVEYEGFRTVSDENPPRDLDVYVDVQSVIDAWAVKYLAWGYDNDGQCVSRFDNAKAALDSLGDMFKSCLSEEAANADYLARYQAWAKALGKSI